MSDRSIPSSEEYEKSVLSTCLQNPERIPEIVDIGVNQKTFYCYPGVWRSISELYEEDEEIELVSFLAHMEAKGRLKAIGGQGGGHAVITEIYRHAVTNAHFILHAEKLRDLEFRREVIKYTQATHDSAYDLDEDLLPLLTAPIDDLLTGLDAGGELITGKDAMKDWLNDWERQIAGGESKELIPCGVPAIDDSRGGLDNPGVICLAGLPSAGKTALMIQIVCHHLEHGEGRILGFSLEMTAQQLIRRCMIHLCGLDDPRWIRKPHDALSDFIRRESAEGRKVSNPPRKVMDRITYAAKILASDRLVIEDDPSLDIHRILAKAKIEQRKEPLDLVFVDHIQLVCENSKKDSVERQMTETSRGIMRGAKMTNCTWLELSQLTETSGTPKLKYASSIEEDAHYAVRIVTERESSEVMGFKIIKDREGGTKGKLLAVDWDGGKQIFKRACHAEHESLV